MSERMRIGPDGMSPLQRLKLLPEAEQEFLISQRRGKGAISVAKLIAQIEARHGISGLDARRWSDFVKWFEERESIRLANESVSNLRSLYAAEEMTPDAVHSHLLDLLRVTGLRNDDLKTLKFVTGEVRKVMQLQHSREKWQEEQRDKIDAGLEAVFQDIKGDPVAVELFAKIKERIRPEEAAQ